MKNHGTNCTHSNRSCERIAETEASGSERPWTRLTYWARPTQVTSTSSSHVNTTSINLLLPVKRSRIKIQRATGQRRRPVTPQNFVNLHMAWSTSGTLPPLSPATVTTWERLDEHSASKPGKMMPCSFELRPVPVSLVVVSTPCLDTFPSLQM